METLVQVLVATVITLRDRPRARASCPPAATGSRDVLRPFLDAAQTMPVVRLPAAGLRAVRAEPVHGHRRGGHLRRAAGHPPGRRRHPDGARRRSSRPRRRPARPVASSDEGPAAGRRGRRSCSPPTRRIILVLSMVVVGGLVGGRRARLRRRRRVLADATSGWASRPGIALVLLGIMLDRITQGAGRATESHDSG